MASQAARAWSSVSATTAATASPTKRTRSAASARRGADTPGVPSGRGKPAGGGMALTPAATKSAPV